MKVLSVLISISSCCLYLALCALAVSHHPHIQLLSLFISITAAVCLHLSTIIFLLVTIFFSVLWFPFCLFFHVFLCRYNLHSLPQCFPVTFTYIFAISYLASCSLFIHRLQTNPSSQNFKEHFFFCVEARCGQKTTDNLTTKSNDKSRRRSNRELKLNTSTKTGNWEKERERERVGRLRKVFREKYRSEAGHERFEYRHRGAENSLRRDQRRRKASVEFLPPDARHKRGEIEETDGGDRATVAQTGMMGARLWR